jgi:uncharacterized membrane protein
MDDDQAQHRASDAVWTYRGYELSAGNFTTSMVHLFRAEITRANVWRQRLDATTNWAVVTTAAVISLAFGQVVGHHSLIIFNTLLITLFLWIEARRYRYYELWSYRVRLMETDFFAAMLVPPFHPAADWAETLAAALLHPKFPITMWEAFGRRYRRNYMWLYLLLGTLWILKIVTQPTTAAGWDEFIQRAAIGGVRGDVVLTIGLTYNLGLMLVGLFTRRLNAASGEVLPRYADEFDLEGSSWQGLPWFRPSKARQQMLTFIITDQPGAVGDRILNDMHRGVTRLDATGLYTGQNRPVLMCALTITEVPQLRAIVNDADPHSLVIVTPAQTVMGTGFSPLDPQTAGKGR